MNDGGPAFPGNEASIQLGESGMSLRDWFAGMAMVGIGRAFAEGTIDDFNQRQAAIECYKLADAMLAEREKK